MDRTKPFKQLANLFQIARDHGFTAIQVKKGDLYCKANGTEPYINASYVSGTDIYLGIYKDKELKLASLFHEIGHKYVIDEFMVSAKYNKLKIEQEAWKQGFELAQTYSITFPEKVHEWAKKQVGTYRKGHAQRL